MGDTRFICLECKQRYVIEDGGAGRLIPCTHCGNHVVIPWALSKHVNEVFVTEAARLYRGETGMADARIALSQAFSKSGYHPGMFNVDPDGPEDLSSSERIDLVMETNLRLAHEFRNWLQGQDAGILDAWPAQELIFEEFRSVPRDWHATWQKAGGKLYAGRMIALKNAAIWTTISRFKLPYPPYDLNCEVGVSDVDRTTAMNAGMIDRDYQIRPIHNPTAGMTDPDEVKRVLISKPERDDDLRHFLPITITLDDPMITEYLASVLPNDNDPAE